MSISVLIFDTTIDAHNGNNIDITTEINIGIDIDTLTNID